MTTKTIHDAIDIANAIANGRRRHRADAKGATRWVMFFGDYVLKIEKGDSNFGDKSNRAEWDFYTVLTDDQRKLYAKPVYITENGKVLVMERITNRLDAPRTAPDYGVLIDEIRDAFPERARWEVLADLHGNNVGWNSRIGRWQVLDYGGWCHCDDFDDHRYYLREVLGLIPPLGV
jgi:hypothetical protein